jgi:hypothetical protein
MCTVTFIPRHNGYVLGMNRDERIARGPALGPQPFECHDVVAVYPRDIEGGTWIGANEFGAAFALLNRNDAPAETVPQKRKSRGIVIPMLLCCHSEKQMQIRLRQIDLSGVMPFRLVAVWPDSKRLHEIRWNARQLAVETHAWEPRHWFSSSLSDRDAGIQRGTTCDAAWNDSNAGSLAWLRGLHSSHGGGPGFSLCVHRETVETLSYTELICTQEAVRCNYLGEAPCAPEGVIQNVSIPRTRVECFCGPITAVLPEPRAAFSRT